MWHLQSIYVLHHNPLYRQSASINFMNIHIHYTVHAILCITALLASGVSSWNFSQLLPIICVAVLVLWWNCGTKCKIIDLHSGWCINMVYAVADPDLQEASKPSGYAVASGQRWWVSCSTWLMISINAGWYLLVLLRELVLSCRLGNLSAL